jgi:hypothetical protein
MHKRETVKAGFINPQGRETEDSIRRRTGREVYRASMAFGEENMASKIFSPIWGLVRMEQL